MNLLRPLCYTLAGTYCYEYCVELKLNSLKTEKTILKATTQKISHQMAKLDDNFYDPNKWKVFLQTQAQIINVDESISKIEKYSLRYQWNQHFRS